MTRDIIRGPAARRKPLVAPDAAALKANGVYYTPQPLVDFVVGHTLGPLFAGKALAEAVQVRILDPACGTGVFLLGAFRWLVKWHELQAPGRHLTPNLRRRILRNNLFGVDVDAVAVETARQTLFQASGERTPLPGGLAENLRIGNALLGPDSAAPDSFDWQAAFPFIMRNGGFDVVLGNPPWGQKDIVKNVAVKQYVCQHYPSSAGIFDWFRPFIELGVRLAKHGGRFGMVLPDTLLLKDYPTTRRYLLDHLALERIDWWGRAFSAATIDVATVIGTKQAALPCHQVTVAIRDKTAARAHTIPQNDFRANPRHVFNLTLTAAKRQAVEQLAAYPQLGDYFEIHEGVHSGNMRAELFVAERVDDSCRELLFGREEMIPYQLNWGGRFVRLGVMPHKKTPQRYANVGQSEWHERAKVLVRRTGDHVRASVERQRRYASNNFFLLFPRHAYALDLDGLCALLNSCFMTAYFRTIEPRRGRAFAELKIKHLRTFPLPATDCNRLNDLGKRRVADPRLDGAINALVRGLFGAAAHSLE